MSSQALGLNVSVSETLRILRRAGCKTFARVLLPVYENRSYNRVMLVTINGEQFELAVGELTVEQLLQQHGFAGNPCAVEINRKIISRAEHDATQIEHGDEIEIVTLVGGG